MCAAVDDDAAVHHHDEVGIDDGAEPMGDDENGAAVAEAAPSALSAPSSPRDLMVRKLIDIIVLPASL